MHDDSRAKTAQNAFLFACKGRAARLVRAYDMNCVVVVVRQSLLVISKRDEAVLQFLKFAAFIQIGRTLDPFAVFGRFCTILFRLEHVRPFIGAAIHYDQTR
ncbi:hypothetical protein CF64_33465 [Bradyrhizobium japonicum]|nr:hypothetical protein CF64_33465 [Bradyrhizobium japonicum]